MTRPLLISVTLGTVGLTFVIPFLFHLLPTSGIPLGARLLPIFYVPLLAALFYPSVVALSACLIAPFLNHVLLGNPPLPMVVQLSPEFLVFVSVVLLLKQRWPQLPLIASFAYLVARTMIFFVGAPAAVFSSDAWRALMTSFQVALPGIYVLLLLNLAGTIWQRRGHT